MKKKQTKSGNVVPFPGSAARLEQRGQEALENKQFDEAIRLYSEALRFEENKQEDIKQALLVAYHEGGYHEEGIELSRHMLHAGEGPYFDVLNLHVLMLIQKKRYKEVSDVLAVLLEEGLPPDRYEQFAHLKAMADRMVLKKEGLFKPEDTVQDKVMKLAELAQFDAAPFEKELLRVLENGEEHPFVQTMALGLLRDTGSAEAVTVRKLQFEKQVVPVMTEDVFGRPFFLAAIRHLEQTAGQANPALSSQAEELIKQYQFLLHPFDPRVSPGKWAEAAVLKTERMYEPDAAAKADEEVAEALVFMEALDEIAAF